MKRTPLLSIVTVTYKDLPGLKQTFDSIHAQEGAAAVFETGEVEWVVVDGDSGDGTREFLESLQTSGVGGISKGLVFLSEKDRGIYDAMNKGFGLSKGDYLYFLNAGDSFAEPEVLKTVLGLLADLRPGVLYGKVRCIGPGIHYEKGKKVGPWDFLFGMPVSHQALIYGRSEMEQAFTPAPPYQTQYRLIADYVLTRECFRKPLRDSYFWPRVIANFDLGGVSSRQNWRILKERIRYTVSSGDFLVGAVTLLVLYPKYALISALKSAGIYGWVQWMRDAVPGSKAGPETEATYPAHRTGRCFRLKNVISENS